MNNELSKLIDMKKSEEEIETNHFIIKDNILRFDHLTLQLSNISRIYAGTKRMRIPVMAISIFVLAFGTIRFEGLRWISLIIMGLTGLYIYMVYQRHQSNKEYLIFQLNSGDNYSLYFQDAEFLNKVRNAVEAAFNHKNMYSEINIAEQKIIQGNHHVIHGNQANLNTGIQQGNTMHSNNHEEHSSTTVGDITDSTIHHSTFGNQNHQKNEQPVYDWPVLEANFKAVITSLKNEDEIKQVNRQVLKAVEEKDAKQFETIIKMNRKIFTSNLFLNTASGVLAQVISTILGIR
ncbi:DUF6232 family protein [Enterococcus faecalis]|uniref:DUF6232 family protein n=1 Tax=Enterococcus faecalis TaxID=1351 RepID=UPI002E769A5A|nr:DUF6232 family protein [Enterococcus faecalis]